MTALHETPLPGSEFSPAVRRATTRRSTNRSTVGDRDAMSILRIEFHLPQCTAVGTFTGQQCTRALGHDEGFGEDDRPDTAHAHASPTGIILEVWR